MKMMHRPPPDDFSLKETKPHLGSGKITGDKLTSTYDLVEQMQYLYVPVVKARDLPAKDVTGSCDPYAEVRLGNYKGINRHFEKKLNPKWNQVFAFSRDRIHLTMLEVAVKDKDLMKDDFMGWVLFDLVRGFSER
ncbi:putative C2 domain-containing protein [Helianthus debilis subsp. tardiflorus]